MERANTECSLAPSRRRLLMAACAASARGLSATTHKKPQQVVIAGGGVIGCATAYYLAKEHGIGAIIVDRKAIAAAASGNAGGFLA